MTGRIGCGWSLEMATSGTLPFSLQSRLKGHRSRSEHLCGPLALGRVVRPLETASRVEGGNTLQIPVDRLFAFDRALRRELRQSRFSEVSPS